MEKLKEPWAADLLNPPLAEGGVNTEWMEHVEKRIGKKRNPNRWLLPLAGSLTLILVAFLLLVVKQDHAGVEPSGHTQVIDGLTVEAGAEIKMSKKADLSGAWKDTTIALVQLPLVPDQDYTGYLGIWDASGRLLQKFHVQGYNIMNPVQIHVQDITGDGEPDLVLETDEHANGGLGVHDVHVYVSDQGQYSEAPLPEEGDNDFTVTYRSATHEFEVGAASDNRSWTVRMSEDHLQQLDSGLLNGSNPVNVDPLSSVDLPSEGIETKRLMWFGNLQLNALAVLVTTYHYEEHQWVKQSYRLENMDFSTEVTENK